MSKKGIAILTISAVIIFSLAGLAYSEEFWPENAISETTVKPDPGSLPPRLGGTARPGPPIMRLMKGLIRGEILTETPSGKRRIKIDRGQVESVSDSAIEIMEKDGKKVSIPISKDTRVVGKKLEEIKAGDKIGAFRVKKGNKYVTKLINVLNDQGLRNRSKAPGGPLNNKAPAPLPEGELF